MLPCDLSSPILLDCLDRTSSLETCKFRLLGEVHPQLVFPERERTAVLEFREERGNGFYVNRADLRPSTCF